MPPMSKKLPKLTCLFLDFKIQYLCCNTLPLELTVSESTILKLESKPLIHLTADYTKAAA